MKFKAKCMYLGTRDFKSKEGKVYHRVALLDVDSQSTFLIFVNEDFLQKVKDYKPFQQYEFDLNLTLGQNSLLRLGVE